MKSISMTVLATLVSMELVWMASIVTVVSACQDSQVMLHALQPHHFGEMGHLRENYFSNVSCFLFCLEIFEICFEICFCTSLIQFSAHTSSLN